MVEKARSSRLLLSQVNRSDDTRFPCPCLEVDRLGAGNHIASSQWHILQHLARGQEEQNVDC